MQPITKLRKVDMLGRVTIPSSFRKANGWETGHDLEMCMHGDKLVITSFRRESEKKDLLKELELVLKMTDNEGVKDVILNAIEFLEEDKLWRD